MSEEKDKEKKGEPEKSKWMDDFKGKVVYDENGVKVLSSYDNSIPFDVVLYKGKKKVIEKGAKISDFDLEFLPDVDAEDIKKNLRNIEEEKNTIKRFSVFGSDAQKVRREGFYPSQWDEERTIFKNRYDHGYNNVIMPNDKQGRTGNIAVVGHKNGLFDIVIMDADGNYKGNNDNYIKRGVKSDSVQEYITNNKSTTQQRVDRITKGIDPEGSQQVVMK